MDLTHKPVKKKSSPKIRVRILPEVKFGSGDQTHLDFRVFESTVPVGHLPVLGWAMFTLPERRQECRCGFKTGDTLAAAENSGAAAPFPGCPNLR